MATRAAQTSRGRMLGVVAAGHPATVGAAAGVLEAGGNAFDAAVAGGVAASIAEPTLTSLGGGGFLLARTAAGQAILFDFFVDTPGRGLAAGDLAPHFHPITVHFPGCDQIFNVGHGSAAVPGNLKGFLHVHRHLGRLEIEHVLAPAVRLAREGVELNCHQAYVIELLDPILTSTDAARRLFAPRGRVLRTGDRFRNPDAAAFIESLAGRSADDLYTGELAARIDADMRADAGMLTGEDLAAYRVIEREPLAIDYRAMRILTNPPPAFGGSLLALSLELLAERHPERVRWGGGEHLLLMVEVMAEVDRRRDAYLDRVLRADAESSGAAPPPRSGGTTQLSVADADGNVASMTTSNGEASGYVVPGTGILLNNMLGEDDLHPGGFHSGPPGRRVSSMMSPSMVVEGDRVRLALGSAGSKRIRTVLLQLISAVVDHRVDVRRAIEAPRVHWDGEVCQVEPGFAPGAIEMLARERGVNEWAERNLYFGGAHAVDPSGEGAGDPRRGGCARVVRR